MDAVASLDERRRALHQVVRTVATEDVRRWLDGLWFTTGAAFSRTAFGAAFAGAGRRFPGNAQGLPEAERALLRRAGFAVPEVLAISDVVRATLLLEALAASEAAEARGLVTETFRRGDSAERVAVLRALPLLPEPTRFLDLAIDACRSHVLDVFAAIACENPYPAAFFPEPNFNQLAIKTMFVELSLSRVLNWRSRNNAELRRMAADFAAERRAAGRRVPDDVALILSTEDAA